MNDDKEFHATYSSIINISWIIIIIVSVILIISGLLINNGIVWYNFALSYFLGAMTNVFAFNLLKNHIAGISSDVKNAVTGSYSNYFLRLIIYGAVIFISFSNQEKLNPYIVISGLFTVRAAIYIYTYKNKAGKETVR